MGFEEWAAARSIAPAAKMTAEEWFAARPALVQQCRALYYEGHYSWEQIHRWLRDDQQYPLRDAKTVSRVCR